MYIHVYVNVPTLVTLSMFNIFMLLFSYPVTLYRLSSPPSFVDLPIYATVQKYIVSEVDGKCMSFLKV